MTLDDVVCADLAERDRALGADVPRGDISNAGGDYVLSEGQELRLLHTIGQEASLGGFDVADDPQRAKRRLATTL